MLKLDHVNPCSRDVAALSGTFARRFAFEVLQTGQMPRTGAEFALLRGSDGFCLVITKIGRDPSQAYPNKFHVGFMVDTADEVHAKHKELSESECHPGPIKNGRELDGVLLPGRRRHRNRGQRLVAVPQSRGQGWRVTER